MTGPASSSACNTYVTPTLVVWRLDRLGRSMRTIINTLNDLTERRITARSINDRVDTATSAGRMVAGILMSIAEYERDLGSESAPRSNSTTPASPE